MKSTTTVEIHRSGCRRLFFGKLSRASARRGYLLSSELEAPVAGASTLTRSRINVMA
jgi:hypothetical protein